MPKGTPLIVPLLAVRVMLPFRLMPASYSPLIVPLLESVTGPMALMP